MSKDREDNLKLINITPNDFTRYTSRRYGRIDIKKYTFRYRTIDLEGAIKICKKNNINISKAIGIGLNYIRSMEQEQAMKLIQETNNELENKHRKNKNSITTIAMTETNWKYLNTFKSKLKYSLLITASRLAKIYNPQKDQYK